MPTEICDSNNISVCIKSRVDNLFKFLCLLLVLVLVLVLLLVLVLVLVLVYLK